MRVARVQREGGNSPPPRRQTELPLLTLCKAKQWMFVNLAMTFRPRLLDIIYSLAG